MRAGRAPRPALWWVFDCDSGVWMTVALSLDLEGHRTGRRLEHGYEKAHPSVGIMPLIRIATADDAEACEEVILLDSEVRIGG
jgi:hypothetical protein